MNNLTKDQNDLVKALALKIYSAKYGAIIKTQQNFYDAFESRLEKFELKYLKGAEMNESNFEKLTRAADIWWQSQIFRGPGKHW